MQELPAVSIAVIKNLMILQKVNLSVFTKPGQQIVIIVRRDGQRLDRNLRQAGERGG